MSKKSLFISLSLLFIFLGSNLLQAKTWNVRAKMSRTEIQLVIDQAKDGDKINFHKGIYDFSDAPMGSYSDNSSALVINNKTLDLVGLPGNQLVGPMSELGSSGYGIAGAKGILIINPAGDKSVRISNLNFKSFLYGISSVYFDSSEGKYYSSLKNLTIENCNFEEIHRTALTIYGIQGNLLIKNNDIQSLRVGLYITWKIQGGNDWQPEYARIDIRDNRIIMTDDTLPCQPPDWLNCGYYFRYGIIIYQADNLHITNNYITGGPSTDAVYLRNIGKEVSTKHQSFIENNTIDSTFFGIDSIHLNNTLVSGNTLLNIVDVGFFQQGDNTNNSFTHNFINLKATMAWSWSWCSPAIWAEGYNNYYAHNTITGYGTAAVLIWSSAYYGVQVDNLIFECNDVTGFTPTPEAGAAELSAHYVLFPETYNCTISEVWNPGTTYLNLSDSSNQFPIVECN